MWRTGRPYSFLYTPAGARVIGENGRLRGSGPRVSRDAIESLLPEVLVESEGAADPLSSHHLEAHAVHEAQAALPCGQDRGHGCVVLLPLDPMNGEGGGDVMGE